MSKVPPNVPAIETALAVIGGKWKILILTHLVPGKQRFGELKRLMPQISEKMLIQQLRELETDGLVERITYGTVPPKVEYSFSPYGRSLCETIQALMVWGEQHGSRVGGSIGPGTGATSAESTRSARHQDSTT
jgi:DNA-binding HxlR family transcriptional regulator